MFIKYREIWTKTDKQCDAEFTKDSINQQCANTNGTVQAIFNAKILIYFSNKIYGSNFVEQHSETVAD